MRAIGIAYKEYFNILRERSCLSFTFYSLCLSLPFLCTVVFAISIVDNTPTLLRLLLVRFVYIFFYCTSEAFISHLWHFTALRTVTRRTHFFVVCFFFTLSNVHKLYGDQCHVIQLWYFILLKFIHTSFDLPLSLITTPT